MLDSSELLTDGRGVGDVLEGGWREAWAEGAMWPISSSMV